MRARALLSATSAAWAAYLESWVTNEATLNALLVPNQTRRIIDTQEGTSLVAVRSLWHELYKLLQRIAAAGKKTDKAFFTYSNSILQV